MPLGRTPIGNNEQPKNTGNIIDMSETINNPNTHGLIDTNETPGTQTGAIPKSIPPPRTYNVPPPNIPKGFSVGNSPHTYAGLINDLIFQSNQEYRAELEQTLKNRIQNSIQDGFSKILKEIKKMNMNDRNSEGIESISSVRTENESIDLTKVQEKEDINQAKTTQRRLDFQGSLLNENVNQSGQTTSTNIQVQNRDESENNRFNCYIKPK